MSVMVVMVVVVVVVLGFKHYHPKRLRSEQQIREWHIWRRHERIKSYCH